MQHAGASLIEPDAALLRASAAGDADAFTAFVERHYGRVLRWARLQGSSRADAEDATQEAFLSAWRSAGTFRGEGSARAWILTIARHAVARAVRRRVGAPAHLESLDDPATLQEVALEVGWGAVDDLAAVDRGSDLAEADAADAVPAALARLLPGDREILTLRDVEGLSGEETAMAIGVTLPAMKSRLHRARLRFTRAYEEVRHGRT